VLSRILEPHVSETIYFQCALSFLHAEEASSAVRSAIAATISNRQEAVMTQDRLSSRQFLINREH
jgi:hypothetical protein